MNTENQLVLIGVDVGTSGVRSVAAGVTGIVLSESKIPLSSVRSADGEVHEQDPWDWWRAVCESVSMTLSRLSLPSSQFEIGGVAVTSTSGTLVLADSNGQPLRPAILYDDTRAASLASQFNAGKDSTIMRLNASQSLTKVAWVRQNEPAIWDKVRFVLHPADWLTGQLTGEFGVSDTSNVLKLGYDPDRKAWNEAVKKVGIAPEQLPSVVSPGQVIGSVCSRAARETGLPAETPVLAGATDGMASLVASGANQFGDANTTLGTTLVWKVLAKHQPPFFKGIYCHLHPSGAWVPGAASNTGPGSLRTEDPSIPAAEMDGLASPSLPTDLVCYLLPGRGERFPFEKPDAESFLEREPRDREEGRAAQLQSIAFVERWGYEILEKCGVTISDRVFSTGSAAKSPILSQLRADILNRKVVRCVHPDAAFGASILAASGTFYLEDICSAIRKMTTLCESCSPTPGRMVRYDEIYASFRRACTRRGYG
jgi:sugar (pentulose or hexulose) kinase